jgi:O-antigen/teichoic acid export membrane protein/SAM-dependent methyltransferase
MRRRASNVFWGLNRRLWGLLPSRALDSPAVLAWGRWLHSRAARRMGSWSRMPVGTMFMRNRPALELMRRLAREKAPGETFRVAVLGCSIGAEVYSIVWTLRSDRPDLDVIVRGVDISPELLEVAAAAAYGPQSSELVSESIFKRLGETERRAMFDWDGDQGRVKPWLRDGVEWQLADICDEGFVATLGRQDIVVLSNVLCHMDAATAERCLRNIAPLVRGGGHVFATAADLDVRTRIALDLGWEPVQELRDEIHDGDPLLRAGWPWEWWGLEPLDRRQPDWESRYACAFRVGQEADGHASSFAGPSPPDGAESPPPGLELRAEGTFAEPALSIRDIGRRAASGAVLLTAKGIFGMALGLASTIVVTRALEPEQLGIFAIALTVSTFLSMLSGSIGLAGALIRRPTAPEHDDLRAYVALQLGISAILVAVVLPAALPLGLAGQLIAVMVMTAPITAFRGAAAVTMERQLLYKRLTSAETAETIVYYAWTIVTVAVGWGLWGLATATVARSIVGTTCLLVLSPTGIVWPRYDWARMRGLLGIGIRVQAIDFIIATRDQILVLGAAFVGSVSIVAYWGLVMRVLQAPIMLLGTLLRVSFPAMARTRSAGGDTTAMLPRLLAAATVLTGTLLAPLAGSAPALVPLLFGERWSPAVDALSLACLVVVIHVPIVIACQSYLWTAGDARSPLLATGADALLCILVGLPLVPLVGVVGLPIGGAAATAALVTILARAVKKQTGVQVVRHLRVPALLWVVAASAAWACAAGPGPLVARTAVSACLSVGLYWGLLYLLRRELMHDLVRRLHPFVRSRLPDRTATPASLSTSA